MRYSKKSKKNGKHKYNIVFLVSTNIVSLYPIETQMSIQSIKDYHQFFVDQSNNSSIRTGDVSSSQLPMLVFSGGAHLTTEEVKALARSQTTPTVPPPVPSFAPPAPIIPMKFPRKERNLLPSKTPPAPEVEFVFIIYSCKKNLQKATFLSSMLTSRPSLLSRCKVLILYGDPELSTLCEFRHFVYADFLVIQCGDMYEDLCEKTHTMCLSLLQLYPRLQGVFKCDDDMYPNIHFLSCMIQDLKTKPVDYMGNLVRVPHNYLSTHHFGKCFDPTLHNPKPVFSCTYCPGPLYYLGRKAVEVLAQSTKCAEDHFYEDLMVGKVLGDNHLAITDKSTYSDHFKDVWQMFYQNVGCVSKYLFVRLHGGLGNQLFQAAAAFTLAKEHHMLPVLVNSRDLLRTMTHNSSCDEFTETIFSRFNIVFWDDKLREMNVVTYKEKQCFLYDHCIIQKRDQNYFLDGYFQHKNYYLRNVDMLRPLFINDVQRMRNIEGRFSLLSMSAFIHVRRGDYLAAGDLYQSFDLEEYLSTSVDKMKQKYGESIHFYVLSDDTAFVSEYPLFKKIFCTIVSGNTTLDDFYLMVACPRGGICGNSTFSGWACTLNAHATKSFFFPPSILRLPYPYEIPFAAEDVPNLVLPMKSA